MATKKTNKSTAPARRFHPLPTIGFDDTPCEHGHLRVTPAVVLAIHPIHGTRVYGPFASILGARMWLDCDAEADLASDWGTVRGWSLHAEELEVPGRWS